MGGFSITRTKVSGTETVKKLLLVGEIHFFPAALGGNIGHFGPFSDYKP